MRLVKTGHDVFDSIANLYEGSLILILDEGHFDSILFLDALLSDFMREKPVIVLTYYDVPTRFNQVKIGTTKSLSDLSIFVSQVREKIGQGIIIHHYLPQLLVQQGESPVLKMIEHWVTQVHGKPLLEILTLPRGTFPTFEKTLQMLLPGVINLTFVKEDERYFRSFSIQRTCKIEYHGKDFPYLIKDGRLLIKIGDEFTDKIPTATNEVIESKKAYLAENINNLKIVVNNLEIGKIPVTDYLLLTQLHDMYLTDVKLIFPEKFDDILTKLAKWIVGGIISVQQVEKQKEKPVKYPGLNAKLALMFPSWITMRFMGKPPRKVPRESLVGLRKTIEVILQSYLPDKKEPFMVLEMTEKFLQEIVGRMTAVERIRAMGEDPRAKLDFKYLPKIVSLSLDLGFKLKCNVLRREEDLWEIRIKDCFICEGIKSDKPVCHIIAGTLTGGLSVAFKEKILCEEVMCKAMGHEACVFLVKKF